MASDNTAPLDRLKIQHGFLHMHAPHTGDVHLLGDATQYSGTDRVVVLAWHTSHLTGVPVVPGQSSRVKLKCLTARSYVDEDGQVYSAAHLTHVGLPFDWSPANDADVVVLRPVGGP